MTFLGKIRKLVLLLLIVASVTFAAGAVVIESAQRKAPATAVTMAPPASRLPGGDDSLLYMADWSQASHGWPTALGWSSQGALLQNDGSDFGSSNWNGGVWNNHWIFAPYLLPKGLSDYAVEAEIQMLHRPACGSFGLVARGAYQLGVHVCDAGMEPTLSMRSRAPQILRNISFDPGDTWHAYRIEVREGHIGASIDGIQVIDRYDANYGRSGSVGLWDDHTEIAVRQFRVQAPRNL